VAATGSAIPHASLCVVHHEAPEALRRALSSVARAMPDGGEVIVVDAGSRSPHVTAMLDGFAPWIAKRGWRLERLPTDDVVAARAHAHAIARGATTIDMDAHEVLDGALLARLQRATQPTTVGHDDVPVGGVRPLREVAGDPASWPPRLAAGSQPVRTVHVWHTEGLGLSGILAWMWRLRTQLAVGGDTAVRLVDLAVLPYGFQQAGPDPSALYDERIADQAAFLAFLSRTRGDVHVLNHPFDYLDAMVRKFGAAAVHDEWKLIGVCHTDQDYYYNNYARFAPALRAIACVSATCARTLAEQIPEHAHKIVLLPAWAVSLPADPIPARAPREPLRLLYTGRIVQYQKRVLDLALLAVRLRQAKVAAELTIVGDGPDLPALVAVLEQVRDRAVPVKVLPVRPPWEMELLLRTHHVLVQVSDFEGASVSLMEALAYGQVPAVTVIRSGHELLEPGINALTAPVGDMVALTAGLATLARDDARRQALAVAARATAERYLGELAYAERFAGLVHAV
jgi:glycosyltransferase involved in cell wall biosynthesis